MADLHHLRLAREAKVEDRPELLDLARRFQISEMRSVAAADAVITHSSYEAMLIRQHLPGAKVHVVPWAMPVQQTAVPFAERGGVAFVGHYPHAPNLDAAHWLIDEIMLCVHALDPAITCLLAGHEMPASLRRNVPGVQAVGAEAALSDIFNRVRVSVAPITYGAGIKGKVLDSLAAGIPCVCTPLAAEGLALPPALQALICEDDAGLAAKIARLHEDEAFNAACGRAGMAYVLATFSEPRIDALMQGVAGMSA